MNKISADQSPYSIEERLTACVWVHNRHINGKSIAEIKVDFELRFKKLSSCPKTLRKWEEKAYKTGERVFIFNALVCPPDPNSTTIESLPNELLYLILKNLSLKEKISVERVSKKWSEVLNRLYLTHNSLRVNNGWSLGHYEGCSERKHNEWTGDFMFTKRNYNIWSITNEIDKHLLSPIVSRCPNIKSVYLENCRISLKTFLWLLDMCPQLECLSLIEVTGFYANDWPLIIEKLGRRLRHLAISDCQSIHSSSLIPIIPFLEELIILYYMSPLNELLANLGPNIRKVWVKCCEEVSVETMRSLIGGNGKRLTHLTIDDPWIHDEEQTLDLLCTHIKNLEYLSIGFGSQTTAIRPIVGLKNLRHLELNANIERWNTMSALTLPTVERLILNVYFSPQNLVGIEKVFPNLRRFRLYFQCKCIETAEVYMYCPVCNICNKFCFQFLSKMKFLKSVSLNGYVFAIK